MSISNFLWSQTGLDPQRDAGIDHLYRRVSHARALLRESADHVNGASCPCCGQHVQVYRRVLSAPMAVSLVLIERYFQDPQANDWLHVPTYLNETVQGSLASAVRGGDFSKLRYWGFLEAKPAVAKRRDAKSAGFYRITPRGQSFVQKKLEAPKYAFIFAGQFLGLVPPYIVVDEALGKYASLVAADK